jgi:hypothetical protein
MAIKVQTCCDSHLFKIPMKTWGDIIWHVMYKHKKINMVVKAFKKKGLGILFGQF